MNPRSRVPWVPITKVHCYVTQSTKKFRLHVQIPLSPKEKQEFKSYTCIFFKKKDSALQKQRTFFFRAATDVSFLNSLILKLLDEKGKVRHLHELLSSLPKSDLMDAQEKSLLFWTSSHSLISMNK